MAEYPAIEGLADSSKARVMLLQSGRQVHAPATAIGLQPLDATLTALAGLDPSAGLVAQTGADAFAKRALKGTTNKIAVTNGDGLAGDPTITIPNAVTLVTPNVTGVLTVSGGQIAFPATQVASASPNTLDDYEEGTWTPTIVFGGTSVGAAYGGRTGDYTKIGRLVFASFDLALTAKGTSTGLAAVTGLPFSGTPTNNSGVIGFYSGMSGIVGTIAITLTGGSGFLRMGNAGGVGSSTLADTSFTNTSRLIGSVTYLV